MSGGPRFKIFEGPPSRSAKGTSWAPYMHEFSRGSRACSSGNFLNLDSLKCHFLDFGGRFYRILMVRKRHCNISEALANVFALSPKPGAPIWPIEVGGPRVLPVWAHSSYVTARSRQLCPHCLFPVVVTSLEPKLLTTWNKLDGIIRLVINKFVLTCVIMSWYNKNAYKVDDHAQGFNNIVIP
jgi:hypothetical protein